MPFFKKNFVSAAYKAQKTAIISAPRRMRGAQNKKRGANAARKNFTIQIKGGIILT